MTFLQVPSTRLARGRYGELGVRLWKLGARTVKLRADAVSEKEGDAPAALLVEGHLQSLGYCILARVVQASQEQDEALLQARRVALSECLHDGAVK